MFVVGGQVQNVEDDATAEDVGFEAVALFVEDFGGDVAGGAAAHGLELAWRDDSGESEVDDFEVLKTSGVTEDLTIAST